MRKVVFIRNLEVCYKRKIIGCSILKSSGQISDKSIGSNWTVGIKLKSNNRQRRLKCRQNSQEKGWMLLVKIFYIRLKCL